ncbi:MULTISPECIES: histidine--tRNA ligase [unclassified Halanaerobium]|uniref:histidine--tRNA ligase n=1 Tax=unclassified Halanaerobium TaxID=2641197 RepID=UPI000DF25E90|nr:MULTISPECIES: histidine--tRNA ligase [unclassified Halanaerobium]RCW43793.1 histidyl-tRNA synthetase [Halanaerobium sp. MA284_MarDTE_T2]RCW80217.1 histidyl-tRNA synthetase [Halanaerobium sp. DL-01]
MQFNAPRGTKDILPPASLKWQYIEKVAREVFANYNYDEIRTPIFEYTELFQRGIGEVTDIVEKEMYTFEDKGGRSLTLRPEGTASVIRSFLENKIYGQAQPTKYYYIGPMFRYERPQSGRFRQFHQLGVEAIGSNDPALDAEIISLGMRFLSNFGLEDLSLHLNSVGCKYCRPKYIEILKDYLINNRELLCNDCKARIDRNPLRVLDCKNERCQSVIDDAPKIVDHLCRECYGHFSSVQAYLDILKINYYINPKLVRGLDYYTNTAFEIKDSHLGAQDTVFGGGRYNGLAEEIGGKKIPGIGFALGIERLLLSIKAQNIEIPIEKGIDLYITVIGENAKKEAFRLNDLLRNTGFKTEMDYLDRSVRSQMKSADRMNADYTIILGEDELENDSATIRNMKTGNEKLIKLSSLINEMKQLVYGEEVV